MQQMHEEVSLVKSPCFLPLDQLQVCSGSDWTLGDTTPHAAQQQAPSHAVMQVGGSPNNNSGDNSSSRNYPDNFWVPMPNENAGPLPKSSLGVKTAVAEHETLLSMGTCDYMGRTSRKPAAR